MIAAQFKHFLLDFKFNRQMRDDGVCQMRTIVNGRQRIQNLHRDFFVQLDVLLEFLQHRAAQGLNLSTATINIADDARACKKLSLSTISESKARDLPSTKFLTVPSGSLSNCTMRDTQPMRHH